MTSPTFQINQWYESLKEQALDRNDKSVATWSKYKSDLEATNSLLESLPKKVKHDIMVPVGPKALMRGKIIHTNEFLVNLGETWFAKRTGSQTIEICNRRINSCDEMLKKLEKERELIVNKSELPVQQDAFGNAERPEIIEYVTEEENEEWKKQHRIKEKEYRQQLAALRQKEKQPIETMEDLWKHLDELELQEELEDELNRLNLENSDDSDNTEENKPNVSMQNYSSSDHETKSTVKGVEQNVDLGIKLDNDGKPKRKVSFALGSNSSFDDNDDDEPLRLEIKHSDVKAVPCDTTGKEINSPGDIYYSYLNSLSKTPGSILKNNVNPNREKESANVEKFKKCEDSSEDEQYIENNIIMPTNIINDVIERHTYDKEINKKFEEKIKNISKFKMSRKNKLQ